MTLWGKDRRDMQESNEGSRDSEIAKQKDRQRLNTDVGVEITELATQETFPEQSLDEMRDMLETEEGRSELGNQIMTLALKTEDPRTRDAFLKFAGVVLRPAPEQRS